MANLLKQKRVLTCTFVAIVSGFFSSYIGGQIAWKVQSSKCQMQPWGFSSVCVAWVKPRAIWQGGTTGLWMGLVLGAFISGLATHQNCQPKEAVLSADSLELTPAQREVLQRFLVLIVVKLGTQDEPNSDSAKLSTQELQRLAELAGVKTSIKQDLTLADLQCLLQVIGDN